MTTDSDQNESAHPLELSEYVSDVRKLRHSIPSYLDIGHVFKKALAAQTWLASVFLPFYNQGIQNSKDSIDKQRMGS